MGMRSRIRQTLVTVELLAARIDVLSATLARIVQIVEVPVGLKVAPGTPVVRKEISPPTEKESIMVKPPTVKLVKKSAGLKKATAPVHGPVKTTTDLLLFDNQDDTATVQGVDAGGNPVDISSVATITVSSSDTASLTVATPVGMTFSFSALKPTVVGTPVNVTVTATWSDGSVGPFVVTLPVDITGTVATGLVVTPGTPTVR